MSRIRLPTMLVLALFALLLALPSAAQELRAPPTNDNVANALTIAVPDGYSIFNVHEATTETDEQPHPCASAATDDSLWFGIYAPAGVALVVDTAGSNYDTVVSVWEPFYPIEPLTLTNLDCEDDGSAPASVKHDTVKNGMYLVSISRVGTGGGNTLNMSASFEVPNSRRPKGYDAAHAVKLKLNGSVTVRRAEYGVNNDDSAEPPSCLPAATAYNHWFRVSVPHNTVLRLSAEGSLFDTNGNISAGAVLTVYPVGTYTQAAQRTCTNTGGLNNAPVIPSVALVAGEWIVRLSRHKDANLTGPSRIKLRTRLIEIQTLTNNVGFESLGDPLEGWKVKNATGDAITTEGAEVIDDARSFKFVGGPNENSAIQQTYTPFVPFPVDEDTLFTTHVWTMTNTSGPRYVVTLTLYYSDGTAEKFKYNQTLDVSSISDDLYATPSRKGTVVKVTQSLKFTAANALTMLIIDNFYVSLTSLVPRTADAPLPPPASTGG